MHPCTRIAAHRFFAAAALVIGAHVTAPTALADTCPDVHVVYARGTDTIPPPFDQVGQALVNSLSTQLAGRSMSVYGINYPATWDLNNGTTSGANDGWVHIQNLVAACPATRLILGGYSQGADVIDLLTTTSGAAFGTPPTPPMPDAIASHVAAVVVFLVTHRARSVAGLCRREARCTAKKPSTCA